MNVIVAEDEILSQKMVVAVLEQIGYKVYLCANGQEVITVLEGGLRPHFLLLDLEMPIKSGMDVLEYLNQHALIEQFPTMIFSAKNQQDVVMRALKMGAHDYIVKPFNPDDLAKRVTDLVFEADESLLRGVLENLRMDDPLAFHSAGLHNWSGKDYDAYQTNLASKTLCVLLPKGESPKKVATWSMAKLTSKVHIFRKCAYGWRKVWPTYSGMEMRRSS